MKCETCKKETDIVSFIHHGKGVTISCKECTLIVAVSDLTCIRCGILPKDNIKVKKKMKGRPGPMAVGKATEIVINNNLHLWIECNDCKGLYEKALEKIKCKSCGKNSKNMIQVNDKFYCNKDCYRSNLTKIINSLKESSEK